MTSYLIYIETILFPVPLSPRPSGHLRLKISCNSVARNFLTFMVTCAIAPLHLVLFLSYHLQTSSERFAPHIHTHNITLDCI